MSKQVLRGMRMRFVILAVVIAVCAVACQLHIGSVGGRFEYRLPEFCGSTVRTAYVEPEGMAQITDIYYEADGTPVLVVEAGEAGVGIIGYDFDGSGGMSQLRVTEQGTVIASGADFTGWEAVVIAVIVCFAVAAVICAWNVLTLVRHAWYGPEMAGFMGGALICAFETLVFLAPLLSGAMVGFGDFALTVTQLADRFVFVSLLPMALAAAFVSVSNVMLVRYEGRSLGNLLGILVSATWAVACLVWNSIDVSQFETVQEFLYLSGVASVVASAISFAVALFVGTSLCAWGASRHVPSQPRDYVAILGCGLRPDGSPTPLLAGRADAALAFARTQEAAGMEPPVLVPSGGQGADEVWSEAEAMRRYLVGQGVDESRIVLEDRSTNTRENLRYTAEIVAREAQAAGKENPRVAFATTNYHVFRGYVYAHDAGLDAEGISAPTKIWFWPNAFLREFVGVLAARALRILLAFVGIALVYLGLEYAVLLTLG